MIHLAQSTYTDRLILIKSHQNSSAFIQNVFLRMIQGLIVGFFHSEIGSYPFFIKSSEGRLIAWFIRYNSDILILSHHFRLFYPLQQRFI